MELGLNKLPWKVQVGIFLAVAVAAVGGFYWYYVQDAQAAVTTQRQKLDAMKVEINKGKTTARQLPAFRQQVTELSARLDNLRAVLPEEKDVSDLLRRLQTLATQSNLTIRSFKPAPIVQKETHAEWPIELELDGTYHNLAAFFDRLGHFARIVNVTGLSVKGKEKGDTKSTISASCVATTFVLLEKPVVSKKAKDKGGKAKPAAGKKAA